MIYVNNLEKSFGKNNVLKGVNEHIKKGEVVVVIGPSGSGKSTFLRCLNLLEEPTGGEIIFEGKNITDKKVNINKLREKMGMVFQQFNLFPHKTVLENITIAPIKVKKMKKSDQNFEYFAEPVMHELMGAKDFGKYADKETGTMQLCFLTNNDITGGNSGSPMFNGKGELIGLAFDGNWDSLSGDIFFDKKLARCIGVDIRYVLYLMDKWGHADRLINEIGAR